MRCRQNKRVVIHPIHACMYIPILHYILLREFKIHILIACISPAYHILEKTRFKRMHHIDSFVRIIRHNLQIKCLCMYICMRAHARGCTGISECAIYARVYIYIHICIYIIIDYLDL